MTSNRLLLFFGWANLVGAVLNAGLYFAFGNTDDLTISAACASASALCFLVMEDDEE